MTIYMVINMVITDNQRLSFGGKKFVNWFYLKTFERTIFTLCLH